MSRSSRALPALLAIAVLAGACASGPTPTTSPTASPGGLSPTPTTAVSERPFSPSSWPVAGSACGIAGYAGRLGRIEAIDARTVRFTLCVPDGVFLARIADPALGILDTATVAKLAQDETAGRSIAGTGPYRIERWDAGKDVILAAAGTGTAPAVQAPTVIVSWAADPAQRAAELQAATVDGIDAPDPSAIDRIETLPELALVPRTGLATAYLAFGNDRAFDNVRVRRAIASGIDRQALSAAAFPAGSTVPAHVVPCAIAGACGGADWYPFNGPAAAADLAAASFNLKVAYRLHVPDRPVPGLSDPLGAATTVQAQLRDDIGLQTTIDVMHADTFAAGVAAGALDGLYLSGVASRVADPGAYLAPLFGSGVASSPARRATGVVEALAEAAATRDPAARAAAFGRANDAIRSAAPLIPLVDPGSMVAFRTDVQGVVVSPLGIDPLGAFTPGDRRQLVFMQASEPAGAYCGDQGSADALRLCALVTDPLYRFAPGTLTVEPRLAERCSPNGDATVWTCTLRADVTFHDGARLDAGDVLASYVAQWDASQPLRAARPTATFAAWEALFGESISSTPDALTPAP